LFNLINDIASTRLLKRSSIKLNGIFLIEVKAMNKFTIGAVSAISALIWSSFANSEPPSGVGSAEGSEGPCFSQTVVGPPGDFLPFLDGVHGVLYTQIGDGKYLDANSAEGTASMTCHGKTKPGEEIAGFDVAAQQPATGTPAGTKAACNALDTYGLIGACRGNNNGAVIVDAELQGGTCSWGDRETLDWTSVRTPSGKGMLSCHFKD
jgi:hypothetical protein